jgi:hypothetical protein
MRAVWTAVSGLVFTLAAFGAEPTVGPISFIDGEFLTDQVSIGLDDETGQPELRLPRGTVPLASDDSVEAGETMVTIVSRQTTETRLRWLDRSGTVRWETRVAADRPVVPFGNAAALLPLDLHEPGIPFSLEILTPAAVVSRERPGATILDVVALEHHLVVSWRRGTDSSPAVAEVLDEQGGTAWIFEAPGARPPRVAVFGQRAAAVYPGRPGSTLDLVRSGEAAPRRLYLAGVLLTNCAFATDDSGILAWGPRDAVWIDEQPARVRWRKPLPGAARPLVSTTSFVTPVGGAVGLVVREPAAEGAWSTGLLLIDVERGGIRSRTELRESTTMPAAVGRFRHGNSERLVLGERIYEIAVPTEDDP